MLLGPGNFLLEEQSNVLATPGPDASEISSASSPLASPEQSIGLPTEKIAGLPLNPALLMISG